MFRIPERDWKEQIENNKRNEIIQRMIDDYLRQNSQLVESPVEQSKDSNFSIRIPEKDWNKQIRESARNEALQKMIEERRKLKFGESKSNPQSSRNDFGVSIPEKDWNDQMRKNEDGIILNELIEEFESLEKRCFLESTHLVRIKLS